jgi:hypothetical protein
MSTPPAPCHVFTPEWVADRKRRYGNRPEHARPTLYRAWTSEEDRPHREVIERWVELLPPDRRQRIIPKLRAPEQFQEAYNELAVGDSLRRMGHAPEYEVEVNGLTPDWLVRPRESDPGFILEVVSSMPADDRERHDEGWYALCRRLEALSGGAVLHIQPPFFDGGNGPVAAPPGPRQKQIARGVALWLKTDPAVGEGLDFDGLLIRFLGRKPNGGGVGCGMSCLPFFVDGAPLREAVKEKEGKYREVSQSTRLPFVVCVVPDFRSGRGIRELEEAVLGRPHARWTEEGPPHQEIYRDNDGLFAKYPTLSAVTLGGVRHHQVTHTVLQNPSAIYPLGNDAFPCDGPATAGA